MTGQGRRSALDRPGCDFAAGLIHFSIKAGTAAAEKSGVPEARHIVRAKDGLKIRR
jgi:hypothetical protein